MTTRPHAALFVLLSCFAACSSEKEEPHGVGGTSSGARGGASGAAGTGGTAGVLPPQGGSAGSAGTAGTMTGPCQGLQCDQTSCRMGNCTQMPCAAGQATTVSGTIYDPAGKVPIYNVIVYVPKGPVPAITSGASCDRCDSGLINPVVATLTDTAGHFTLGTEMLDVPVGADIPLVIQIGKWRRQITIPNVARCADTPLTDINQTRLPRNKSEGDIPLIAITTGGADSMECLPRRMGIDDAEFTTEAGDGRIHLYSGADAGNDNVATKEFDAAHGGTTLTRSTTLWGTTANLSRYDIVILSCEGDEIEMEKPMSARQAMYDYASAGGRVFASHWHHYWLSNGPAPVPTVATWSDREDPESPETATINTSFTKGAALAEWLVNVQASTTLGQMDIIEPRDNAQAVNATLATEWMRISNSNENDSTAIEYLSFNTPVGAADDMICGRVVYTDLHVSSTGNDMPGDSFPASCEVRDLSPQEKAVEFMLFDLSSCVTQDDVPPKPPEPH